jgi:beta-phosphoglucomutase
MAYTRPASTGQKDRIFVRNLRAVFFDLDGTIVDSIPAHARAWKQILSEVGITLSELYIELHEGEKAEETITRLARECNLEFSHRELMDLIDRKRALYRASAVRGLAPGARDMLEQLIAGGVECDIVTGSARGNIDSALTRDEIELFTHIIAAENYAYGKPHPDPYLTALRQSGWRPEDCVVLENAPLGIHSAREAGIRVVAITTTLPPEYLHEADRVVRTYEEFLTAI